MEKKKKLMHNIVLDVLSEIFDENREQSRDGEGGRKKSYQTG